MTEAARLRHLHRRRVQLDYIKMSAEDHKVCHACYSISLLRAKVCPFCGSYRFDEDPRIVRAVARRMGLSPFPLRAGVVPRLFG
jgi:hypothetical protein